VEVVSPRSLALVAVEGSHEDVFASRVAECVRPYRDGRGRLGS